MRELPFSLVKLELPDKSSLGIRELARCTYDLYVLAALPGMSALV